MKMNSPWWFAVPAMVLLAILVYAVKDSVSRAETDRRVQAIAADPNSESNRLFARIEAGRLEQKARLEQKVDLDKFKKKHHLRLGMKWDDVLPNIGGVVRLSLDWTDPNSFLVSYDFPEGRVVFDCSRPSDGGPYRLKAVY